MSKTRYPRSTGLQVARELCRVLGPVTERLIVAGSLRRMKADVGDVEILFVPRIKKDHPVPGDMFARRDLNLAEQVIVQLEADGILAKRPSTVGTFTYGALNKLKVHVATGLPVDLFTASVDNWWNYVVCRTGPAESNTRIAQRAQELGWKWNPYGKGFTRESGAGETRVVSSEQDLFAFLGLPYLEPKDR